MKVCERWAKVWEQEPMATIQYPIWVTARCCGAALMARVYASWDPHDQVGDVPSLHRSPSLPPSPLPVQLTAVFAQLTVAGKWEGPHAFTVRIHDDALRPVPGVRIKDLGPKMGLNGIDNGQVRGGGTAGRGKPAEPPLGGGIGRERSRACTGRCSFAELNNKQP